MNVYIGTEGVKLGGQLSIPGVQLGWISVSGIAFWAAIVLPFDGSSVLFRFAFSSPDNPFKATVYGLGGGGHFAVELATDEIRAVEASIEFVGNVGADLVVAAGRLTVEIGIFYRNQGAPSDQVVLRGFMRATGRLSVLGLLNLSVEFYAAIQLVDENNERVLFFKAHVIVSVDILFIHESVGIEFQKVLWRSSDSSQLALPGPTRQLAFGELVSQDDWNVYCDSFAA